MIEKLVCKFISIYCKREQIFLSTRFSYMEYCAESDTVILIYDLGLWFVFFISIALKISDEIIFFHFIHKGSWL